MVIIKLNFVSSLRVLLLLTCLCIVTAPTFAAMINATVDRNPVKLDESFQLTLTVEGSADGEPNFDVLQKDFEILSRSQNNSFQVINGQMSRQSQWSITLMAKAVGKFTIPSIHIGNEHSQAIDLTITQAAPSSQASTDVFLEVNIDAKENYVQAQLIYTLRLYRAVNLSNASLSELKTSGVETIIEKLGDDSEFETQRNGQRFRVIERRYAIFPQQSGGLIIEPVIFNGQIVQSSSRFSANPFLQKARNKRLRSEAITIKVKPAPTLAAGQSWLPARNIQLKEIWQEDPPSFKAGEAVTRTLTITADGLLAAQLPVINITMPNGLKHYSDQAAVDNQMKSTGIIGKRQQKIAIIPAQAGQYTLPEIKLDWWNTQTQRKETLRIPQRNIQVMAADAAATKTSQAPEALEENAARQAVNSDDTGTTQTNKLDTLLNAVYWPWLSLILAAGWLGTFLIMRGKSLPQTINQATQQRTAALSSKAAASKLKQTCLNNDPLATKEALLAWAKIRFSDQASTSLADLSAKLDNHAGRSVAEEIEKLNQALYSQANTRWQGLDLWQAIDRYCQSPVKKTKKDEHALSPLYP